MASTTRAENEVACEECKSGIALPGEPCRVKPRKELNWTEPEQWAWTEICEGRPADFNKRYSYVFNLKNPDEWSYDNFGLDWRRTLTPDFLRTILLNESFRSAIPHRGVRIIGAYIEDEFDLSDAPIERLLGLVSSLFKSPVVMRRLTTPKVISFNGSRFDGDLDMNSAVIGGHLFMSKAAEFNDVDLSSADIGGQLEMDGSRFKGKLDMDSASVGGNLYMRNNAQFGEVVLRNAEIYGQLEMNSSTFVGMLNMSSTSIRKSLLMRKAEFGHVFMRGVKVGGQLSMIGSKFKDRLDMSNTSIESSLYMRNDAEFENVNLIGAKIGGQLDMSKSKFKGKLNLSSVSIGGHLSMRRKAEFGDVLLAAAKIGGHLSMTDSKFKGDLNMSSTSIRNDLFMRKTQIDKPANLIFINVGSNLDLRGAIVRQLYLRGARIERDLWLGLADSNVAWKYFKDKDGKTIAPKFSLRNANVGTLQATKDSWPDYLELELDGFTYNRLGAREGESPYERGSGWFIKWLGNDQNYTPQPYRHLASVLRAAGHEDMADHILYESRAREHRESGLTQFKWWVLWPLWLVIGYGYGWRKFLALVWIILLVFAGMSVLRIARERDNIVSGYLNSAFYSLDILLPVIRLRERHYKDVDLTTWARYYFYFHQIMGYVLIFFVIAGLSGLIE
ncbi:MAG: hypothetical protein OXL41_13850 [Nitrospinae bacterium]|nr:hypothetical protein [Nitrospinota bacterium]